MSMPFTDRPSDHDVLSRSNSPRCYVIAGPMIQQLDGPWDRPTIYSILQQARTSYESSGHSVEVVLTYQPLRLLKVAFLWSWNLVDSIPDTWQWQWICRVKIVIFSKVASLLNNIKLTCFNFKDIKLRWTVCTVTLSWPVIHHKATCPYCLLC